MTTTSRRCALPFVLAWAALCFAACEPECRYYNDCPYGSYCSPDRVCVEDDVPPGSGGNGGAPSCTASVGEVNGVPAAPGTTLAIRPLDDVRLRVEPRGMPAPLSYAWTILARPDDSTVELTDPAATRTGFTFADGVLGLDLTGRYSAEVRVSGGDVEATCSVTLDAVPAENFLVELTWSSNVGDIDLHIIQRDGEGRYCAALGSGGTLSTTSCEQHNTCYFGGCQGGGGPDWDGDSTTTSAGDPSLDIDDLCGYGPENINVDAPISGRYLVAAHFFGFTGCPGSGSISATIRVYLDGALAFVGTRTLVEEEWWEAAEVVWSGPDSVCVEDLATPALECAAP